MSTQAWKEGGRYSKSEELLTGRACGLAEVTREGYFEYAVQEKEMKWPLKEPCIM